MSAEAPSRPRDEAPPPQQAQAQTPQKKKDPFFSNAKVALIALVVIGHAIAPIANDDNTLVRAIYMTLYDFHMPAFILLSGYFSKTFTGRPTQLYRMLTTILVPYVIFSLLYGMLRIWLDAEFSPSFIKPFYLLWFLAALFVWRLTAPFWHLVRYPITVATTISLGASTMEMSGVLDLSRILQFLPFFVAGMFLERRHFEMLRRPLVRIVGPILCCGIFLVALFYGGDIVIDWVYFTAGANELEVDSFTAVFIKAFLLACAAILIATFLSFVPDREFRWSKYGELTMYPFLLHGFFTRSAEHGIELFENDFMNSGTGALLATAGALVLALILFSKPVRWATKPLIEPNLDWLVRKPPRPPSPRPRSATPEPAEPAGQKS